MATAHGDLHGYQLFGATAGDTEAMRAAGPEVSGTVEDLLGKTDVVVDCTPKKVAAKNVETYRRRGMKFILQEGEKHEATGHSFVAESSYAGTIGRESTRVVSCTTTSSFARSPLSSGPASSAKRGKRSSAAQPTHGKAIIAAS